MCVSSDNAVLNIRINNNKIFRKAGTSDDEIAMLLRMPLRIDECIYVHNVWLIDNFFSNAWAAYVLQFVDFSCVIINI